MGNMALSQLVAKKNPSNSTVAFHKFQWNYFFIDILKNIPAFLEQSDVATGHISLTFYCPITELLSTCRKIQVNPIKWFEVQTVSNQWDKKDMTAVTQTLSFVHCLQRAVCKWIWSKQ